MNETLTGTELTCHQIIDFVRAYLAGELLPREHQIFELHLILCPDCVRYLQSYQATQALAQQALAADALTTIPEDLLQAILASRQEKKLPN